jgi:hypothetical protein
LQQPADLPLCCHHCCSIFLQVFQTFIYGFGVYGPLLRQVKQGFDQAIEAGLRDALDNSNRRLQLLAARQEQAAATAAARAEIVDGEQHDLLSVKITCCVGQLAHLHHLQK